MLAKYELADKDIVCRNISISDCTEEYLSWLNDKKVNIFLETRWVNQDLFKIKDFVYNVINSNHSILFAIVVGNERKHIGNIKIGPINSHYNNADISYFIGDKEYWGKGIATKAIKLVSDYGFNELGLHRIQAGVFDENIGSIKALIKAGFVEEASFKEALISPITGKYCSHLYFSKMNSIL